MYITKKKDDVLLSAAPVLIKGKIKTSWKALEQKEYFSCARRRRVIDKEFYLPLAESIVDDSDIANYYDIDSDSNLKNGENAKAIMRARQKGLAGPKSRNASTNTLDFCLDERLGFHFNEVIDDDDDDDHVNRK